MSQADYSALPSPKQSSRRGGDHIERTIQRFSSAIIPLPERHNEFQAPSIALITGTTGNLGATLLQSMIVDDRIERIYAVNRASRGGTAIMDRHVSRFVDCKYDVKLLESNKLVFVEADTTRADFGLDAGVHDEIRKSVNLVIHAAWRLNFRDGISVFEDNLQGMTNLINFVLSTPNPHRVRVLFTSSIMVTQSWDIRRGQYPEELQWDAGSARGGGYGESKYVSERLLDYSKLNATTFRIMQVTGGRPSGMWNASDWLPALLQSCLSLGVLPSSKGLISWIPFDAVGTAMLDAAFVAEELPLCLNIAHPRPVPWEVAFEHVLFSLRKRGRTTIRRTLPFPHWVPILEEAAVSAQIPDFKRLPALKLLDFYRRLAIGEQSIRPCEEACGMARLSTKKMESYSPTLRSLKPLNQNDIDLWIDYWLSKGLFGEYTASKL